MLRLNFQVTSSTCVMHSIYLCTFTQCLSMHSIYLCTFTQCLSMHFIYLCTLHTVPQYALHLSVHFTHSASVCTSSICALSHSASVCTPSICALNTLCLSMHSIYLCTLHTVPQYALHLSAHFTHSASVCTPSICALHTHCLSMHYICLRTFTQCISMHSIYLCTFHTVTDRKICPRCKLTTGRRPACPRRRGDLLA